MPTPSEIVKTALYKLMPVDMPNKFLCVGNNSLFVGYRFLPGDIFRINELDWTFTIVKVQNFTIHIKVETADGKTYELKRCENAYLANNMDKFEYIIKIDRDEYHKNRMEELKIQKAEKKKANALKRKKAQLAKLQAEIAEMEN